MAVASIGRMPSAVLLSRRVPRPLVQRRNSAINGRAALFTGFEDSNSSANVDIDRKATGQRMFLSNIGENLTLITMAAMAILCQPPCQQQGHPPTART